MEEVMEEEQKMEEMEEDLEDEKEKEDKKEKVVGLCVLLFGGQDILHCAGMSPAVQSSM